MPRSTLTLDQIVRAAVELLDVEGLEGLNLRDLGRRLGCAATAIYWHVGSKDDLIVLAGDHVWAGLGLPDVDGVGWRIAATRMAADLHATLLEHSWLVQAFGSYVIFGPGRARYVDRALAVYEAAGLSPSAADRAMAAVFTFVLGNALGPAAASALARKLRREGGEDALDRSLAGARRIAADFPHLAARLGTEAAQYAASPAGTFDFGLQALLGGIESQLGAGSTKHVRNE